MSPAEVKYIKGYPPHVLGPPETQGEFKGTQPVIDTNEIEKGKTVEGYTEWAYEVDHHRIDVTFNSARTAVIVVQCYSDDKLRRCPAIAGIADGNTEQEVVHRFGQPDRSEISGVSKNMFYPRIGVFFWLTQERVYMLGINDPKYGYVSEKK